MYIDQDSYPGQILSTESQDRLTAKMKEFSEQHASEIEQADNDGKAEEVLHDDQPTGAAPQSRIARIVLMSVRVLRKQKLSPEHILTIAGCC